MNNSRFSAIREETVQREGREREGAPLRLYLTSSCHLCEQAEALLQGAGLRFEAVEIADDDDLLEQYGVRIPVVRHVESGQELDWPFDRTMIGDWLRCAA